MFGCFGCQLRKALIGSSSPVSSSSSSSNYILVLFSSVLFLVLGLFAFLFLFWLGCAVDHRPHTPTTTPFQYVSYARLQMITLQSPRRPSIKVGSAETRRCYPQFSCYDMPINTTIPQNQSSQKELSMRLISPPNILISMVPDFSGKPKPGVTKSEPSAVLADTDSRFNRRKTETKD